MYGNISYEGNVEKKLNESLKIQKKSKKMFDGQEFKIKYIIFEKFHISLLCNIYKKVFIKQQKY